MRFVEFAKSFSIREVALIAASTVVCCMGLALEPCVSSRSLAGLQFSELGIPTLLMEVAIVGFVSVCFFKVTDKKPTFGAILLAFIWDIAWLAGKFAQDFAPVSAFLAMVICGVFFFMAVKTLDALFDKAERVLSIKRGVVSGKGDARKVFFIAWIVIFACWLPYMIALYPGCIAPNDTLDQLQQLNGIESFTSTMSGQLTDGVYYSNHHPFVHTLILGAFLYGGQALGSANAGMFALVVIQALLASSGMAFALSLFRRIGAPVFLLVLAGALVAVVPHIPTCICSISKDSLFTGFFIWLLAIQLCLVFGKGTRSRQGTILLQFLSAFFALGCCLLRSAFIFVFILVVLFAIIHDVRQRKSMHSGFAIGLVAAMIVVNVIYPANNVAPVSSDEKWAVMLQQIGASYLDHGDDFTDEQLAEVDRVLTVGTIHARFEDRTSDALKNDRPHDGSASVNGDTIKLWFSCLVEFPESCIRAWSHLASGYLFPAVNNQFVITTFTSYYDNLKREYINETQKFKDLGLDLHDDGIGAEARSALSAGLESISAVSVSHVLSMGTIVWFIFYAFYRSLSRRRRDIVLVTMLCALLAATLVLSPAAGLFRYALPFYFAASAIICALVLPVPPKNPE